MSGEPLWAALLAVAFTAEQWSGRLVVGGALLLAANVVTALSSAGGRSRSVHPVRTSVTHPSGP